MFSFRRSHLISELELELIREQFLLPELEIILSEDWSSDNPTHRHHIRENLLALADKELEHNRQSLSNLGEVPNLSSMSLSITHCLGMGGYAYVPRPWQVGFDIEVSTRLNPQVVRRVCDDVSEVEAAPDAGHLWVAKESSFKALLGDHQPTVIGDIEVSNWREASFEKAHLFTAKPMGGAVILQGISLVRGDYHLGLSLFTVR